MPRNIDRKLRLTAALLGAVTRKDLAGAFRCVNANTSFDVGRAHKWLQGRAQPREREYIQAVRAIWAAWKGDGKLSYEGKHYRFTLMTPNFVPEAYDGPAPRIGLAAVGPFMLKVAAEDSDGAKLHVFCTRKYLENKVMPILSEGLSKTGRAREDFEISGGGFVVTGKDDEAVQKLFDWVRYRVAFYGSTPAYWPVFEEHGLGDLGRKLNAMTKAGQWDAIAAEVPDDVVHLFAAVGRHDQSAPAPIRPSRPTCRPTCCRTWPGSRRATNQAPSNS